jgi:hypothetical protein
MFEIDEGLFISVKGFFSNKSGSKRFPDSGSGWVFIAFLQLKNYSTSSNKKTSSSSKCDVRKKKTFIFFFRGAILLS